jgi:hypothetical protein
MVLSSIGVYTTAQAADLPNISNTLTDSNPGSLSGHLFSFDIPTGSSLGTGDTVTVTFPTTPDTFGSVSSVVSGDLTVRVDGGAPVAIGGFVAGASSLAFNNVAASAGQTVTIEVADDVITNPNTVSSYEFIIDTGTGGDSGRTRVAIVDNVLVSAIVDTVFDFTISGLATSSSVNGTSTTGSTTPTEINFGTLIANESKSLAQRLNVRTNARNGFVVTVESDGDLQSGNGAVIDNFADGSDVAVPGTTWTAPSGAIGDDTTWGHWGLTTNDSDLGSLGGFYTATDFGANEYIAASTTPREVFHHDGPSDNTTQDIGQADVLYQIQITPLQEAANDYNTTLTYIATPTF